MAQSGDTGKQSITVAFTGDLVPSSTMFEGDEPIDPRLNEVRDIFASADVAIASLLSPLSERGTPIAKMINLRSDPSLATDLRKFGFSALHLANNHSMDLGFDALSDTVAHLADQGIASFGAGANLAAATEGLIVEAGGLRIGLLAWSALLAAGSGASPLRPGIAPLEVTVSYEIDPIYLTEEPTFPPTVRSAITEASLTAACARISEVRAQVDVLLVVAHWGEGVGDRIGEYMQPLAHAMLDAGADAVLGTHPHSVYGVEVYDGKPVFYSPGLFIDQTPRTGNTPDVDELYANMSPDSYIAVIEATTDGVVSVRLVPTTLGGANLPVVAGGSDADRIQARLESMSRRYSTTFERDGRDILVPLAAS
jgi:poly-gamma-glutamate capsule biosynthesis protein CapA/YwtB (metallophosphatase superfamily)